MHSYASTVLPGLLSGPAVEVSEEPEEVDAFPGPADLWG